MIGFVHLKMSEQAWNEMKLLYFWEVGTIGTCVMENGVPAMCGQYLSCTFLRSLVKVQGFEEKYSWLTWGKLSSGAS